jgi:hypothetical protein
LSLGERLRHVALEATADLVAREILQYSRHFERMPSRFSGDFRTEFSTMGSIVSGTFPLVGSAFGTGGSGSALGFGSMKIAEIKPVSPGRPGKFFGSKTAR